MDQQEVHGEIEVKNNTERETNEDSSNMKDGSPIAANANEIEAERDAVSLDKGSSENVKASEEHPVETEVVEPAGISQGDHTTVENICASEDVNVHESIGDPVSCEDTVEGNNSDDVEQESLLLATTSSAREDKKQGEHDEIEHEREEPYSHLFQELCTERDEAVQHNVQLQMKLTEYLQRKARDTERPVSEHLQEYETCMDILSPMKQKLAADSEAARQKTEELRILSQESLDMVEGEWKAFMALKQHVAVTAMSRSLSKQEAQAKVETTLVTEQLRQDELVKLRLRHIKLKMKIHRLEAELQDIEKHGRDPLQLQYQQLQAARLEQKKQAEKESEESMKLQAKISSSLEVLANVKEKLFWSQTEVQTKRKQLAEVEATVAGKRDVLTRTKQAHNRLQRDNQRLKECRGLLGNMVLLRDFEDTVDASDLLEEQLGNLKCRQAEVAFRGGRWKKKLETSH